LRKKAKIVLKKREIRLLILYQLNNCIGEMEAPVVPLCKFLGTATFSQATVALFDEALNCYDYLALNGSFINEQRIAVNVEVSG
jgi:hypothetical protein